MTDVEDKWLDALAGQVEAWELEELQDPVLRDDAFSRDVAFGTGGIRALMGVGPNRLNALTVARASAGLAAYLGKTCGHASLVVIAFDTRIHNRDFAWVAARALAAAGCRVRVFPEPTPTPVLSFAVRELRADAGVVITASHNPREYNGYKVYGPTGCQATDALCGAVAAEIAEVDPFAVSLASLDETLADVGVSYVPDSVWHGYIKATLARSTGVDCSGLRVAYSPLDGTGLGAASEVLGLRDVMAFPVLDQLGEDGSFPTCPRPNPELPEAMRMACDLALEKGCDLALATDPDADRVGVAVRHGGGMARLTGDEVGLLLLDFLCEARGLPADPLAITTIVSSPLYDEVADAHGLGLRRTLTGFKYVGEQLDLLESQNRRHRLVLGAEESCGYLAGERLRDKDGVLACMLVCECAAWHRERGRDLVEALGELYDRYGHVVSRQVTVEADRTQVERLMHALRENPPAEVAGFSVERVTDYSRDAPMPGDPSQTLPPANVLQLDLAGGSRLMVRPSGTEPRVKAYCFAAGVTAEEATLALDALCGAACSLMGAEGIEGKQHG